MEDNEIPVEFIAEALRKPENVHLNLEPSDYIQDPALHSVYKAHYVERKLIKPDYGKRETGCKLVISYALCLLHKVITLRFLEALKNNLAAPIQIYLVEN